MTLLLVLHDGSADCVGEPWRDAFERAGWTGTVLAPDLPGHGSTPPPADGNYDVIGAAWHALRVLNGEKPTVVVGVGSSAYAARMFALGGKADAVVTVDSPAQTAATVEEMVADYRQWLRDMSDDPAAMAEPPHHHGDPRIARSAPPSLQRPEFAAKVKAAITVPLLELDEADADAIAEAVVDWAATQ